MKIKKGLVFYHHVPNFADAWITDHKIIGEDGKETDDWWCNPVLNFGIAQYSVTSNIAYTFANHTIQSAVKLSRR